MGLRDSTTARHAQPAPEVEIYIDELVVDADSLSDRKGLTHAISRALGTRISTENGNRELATPIVSAVIDSVKSGPGRHSR